MCLSALAVYDCIQGTRKLVLSPRRCVTLDPVLQEELEQLNQASAEINLLELQLDVREPGDVCRKPGDVCRKPVAHGVCSCPTEVL